MFISIFRDGDISVKFIEYFPGMTLGDYVAAQKKKTETDPKFISTAIKVVKQLLDTVRLKVDIFRFEFFCFLVR